MKYLVNLEQVAFNPRSYKRSDPYELIRSIVPCAFNPRSYKRSDQTGSAGACRIYYFQSTLLQEERHNLTKTTINQTHFQSTLLQEERHHSVVIVNVTNWLSIHAPTRGATCIL